MSNDFNSSANIELYNFRFVDVFIVFVKTKEEAIIVQEKFHRMGFCDNNFIEKYECYYIAQIIISDDFRNGKRFQTWGRDEVEKSLYFYHSLIRYEDFMKI